MMKRFPIGFWNYNTTGQHGAKDVRDWVELGMTMAQTPNFNVERDDRKAMLELLDACAEQGVAAIVRDDRALWGNAKSDPEGYEKRFREAYEEFGHHPATVGFFIGDEPFLIPLFEEALETYRIQKTVAPELTPHLNFLPYHYWNTDGKNVMSTDDYTKWLERMVSEAQMPIVCYDCYEQMNPEEEGTERFFYNLRMTRDAATALNIDPWTTLLSAGHFRFRPPNENDLRWQLNTAVACGMKGILWFIIYERVCRINYRLPPFDAFGQRTETFNWLSRTNRYFLHQFGDFFLRAKHIKTYHLGKAYGGYDLWEAGKCDDVVYDVLSQQGLPAVVGFFELDGEKYVAIVNNSTTESGFFSVCVPKNIQEFHQWTWDSELLPLKKWLFYSEDRDMCCGGDWHYPGQMKLYHIKA